MVLPIDTIPGAMLRVDPAGGICELNQAAQKLDSGLAKDENLFDWISENSRENLKFCLHSENHNPDHSREFEASIGTRRFRFAIAGETCPDHSRFVQITDITEYRALSERVAMNEQRYRSLFTENPDAVCSLDLNGRLVETNHCTDHLTGFGKEQLCNAPWESLVDQADRDAARLCFDAALAGRPCSYRCTVIGRNGRRSIAEVTYIPTLADGEVVGVFGIARDKTERHRLEESRRLLEACMAQIQDVIIITETEPLDEPGPPIIYVNDGVERMTGFRPDEILGKTPRMFQGPETDARALERIRKALEARKPVKDVLVNYCKDGEPFWNEIEIVPIPAAGKAGKAYFASVQRDITQSMQRESELRRSREELRRLSQAQEQILEQERRRIARDLHDELGQTLTALKLSLGMALDDMNELLPDHVRRLEKIVGHVDEAVEKVRDISANLRPAMLDDLGFEAAAEWFLNECESRTGLGLQWNSEPSGESVLKGDVATALFRILQECMTNISRHSDASSVCVDYRESDERVTLDVRDNGAGFDPGKVRKSGFGLVGMRERVAMMGGDLTVESAIGKGVHISVMLPREEVTQ
ncbi:PAS domain-containing sensor histidine kinase [Marinobacter halotolerans]|uniref:PAS domain-containing sensor histidine kinase n=1 Tax=Marinobacter halotolerans TaxID=1569211 RepID=UPI00124859E3|nr:PAS domain-containing sensor histidine kinase [Marinobacter halotolerans]